MGNCVSCVSKWRYPGQDEWTEQLEEDMLKAIKPLDEENIKMKAHFMLCGPNGAGKSSFMNSVIGICKRRQVHMSSTGPPKAEGTTLTKKYIRVAAPEEFSNFRLTDTPGLLEPRDKGLHVGDVVALVQGHIKVGYTFEDTKTIDDQNDFYVLEPTDEERVHCLVIVCDATKVDDYTEKYASKISEITEALTLKNIPHCMILTKIDLLDTSVGKDIKKIHESTIVKRAVENAARRFRVEKRNIFPVVNFVKDPDIMQLTKIPHLLAMKAIIGFAKDYIDRQIMKNY